MGLLTKYRLGRIPTVIPVASATSVPPPLPTEPNFQQLDKLQEVNSRNETPDEVKTRRLNKFLKNQLRDQQDRKNAELKSLETHAKKQQAKKDYDNSLIGRYNKAKSFKDRLWVASGQTNSMLGWQKNPIYQGAMGILPHHHHDHEEETANLYRQQLLKRYLNSQQRKNNP